MTIPYSETKLSHIYQDYESEDDEDDRHNQSFDEILPELEPPPKGEPLLSDDNDDDDHSSTSLVATKNTIDPVNASKSIQPSARKKIKIYTFQPEHLMKEKGLYYLVTEFPKIHFKGAGHETEDLLSLIHQYENWGNRLFPKLKFKDLLDRIEVFGTRGEIKACKSRIRCGELVPKTNTIIEDDIFAEVDNQNHISLIHNLSPQRTYNESNSTSNLTTEINQSASPPRNIIDDVDDDDLNELFAMSQYL